MVVIEISVDSIDSALAAEQGGANRIELCSTLREGGITPSLGLLRTVRSRCGLPTFAIVRPRGGDFLYTADEFHAMQEDIRVFTAEGIQGVVLGLLMQNGHVDVERTRALVELASPMEVTFHRALDMTPDPEQALEDVITCGVRRVLTSGGASDAWSARERLRSMVQQARGRTTIVVGGGVRTVRIAQLIQATGAKEFHSSMRRFMPSPMNFQPRQLQLSDAGVDEFKRNVVSAEEVRELVRASALKQIVPTHTAF